MTNPSPSPRISIGKILLPIGGIIAVVVAGLFALKSQVGQRDPGAVVVSPGATLPDFALRKMDGGSVKASELKSKVTLINFWATWCEACIIEMPSIVKLRETYRDRGFEVIGVNVDERPESVVPAAMKELGITFPVYFDADGELAELFDVHAIPFTAIIDKDRKILFVESGERDWFGSEVRNQLEQWLKP